MKRRNSERRVARRDFLKVSSLILTGMCTGGPFAQASGKRPRYRVRFGIAADSHYAEVPARGSRYYRESAAKLAEYVELMNSRKADFLVHLGDFKDQDQPPSEKNALQYLDTIESIFRRFQGPRYHVLGNHDMDCLSKEQFLTRVENTGVAQERSWYSFDSRGLHFVVLDANYLSSGADYCRGNFDWTDANVPPEQLAWLARDLDSASRPAIVFIHQQLDGQDGHTVRNAAEVRQCLQDSKRVLAVFQGHHHEGDYRCIEGIHYYTLKAMVEGSGEENNAYALVEVRPDGSMTITGYRRAESVEMGKTLRE
jgi:alkaline phosphatase